MPRSLKLMILLLVGSLCWAGRVQPAFAQSVNDVNWKLFFNQVFAIEIERSVRGRGLGDAVLADAWRRHTAYTPNTFNQTIDKVLTAKTSIQAYNARQEIYTNEDNIKLVTAGDFRQSVPPALANVEVIAAYLSQLQASRSHPVKFTDNFLKSVEGKAFMQAISHGAEGPGTAPVAFVLVPGYAAHTIKFEIFPEILGQVNEHWQRPASRPILDEGNGIDIKYEPFQTFYSRGPSSAHTFDILHPAGWEMGNTVGFNAETAELLATWINTLPPNFARHRLVLLGYSKGAPTILEMLAKHPEIAKRVLGVVSFAGAVQGTHVARMGRDVIDRHLGAHTIGELVTAVRKKGIEQTLNAVLPFLSPLDSSFLEIPRIKQILGIYGFETKDLETQTDRLVLGRETKELRDGIVDLEPMTRTVWNLKNLNKNLLRPGGFIFNISAVTDISTFASRPAFENGRIRKQALISPSFAADGKLDWSRLSLDAWFLYLSSLGGFKLAPGGLYDTQVDLQHTKTPWLDESPLGDSLTQDELAALWNDPAIRPILQSGGATSPLALKNVPRSRYFPEASRGDINAIDLGEFKGHHWSLFLQAFRPPPEISKDFYVSDFPRDAFMRALLQVMAFYNLVQNAA